MVQFFDEMNSKIPIEAQDYVIWQLKLHMDLIRLIKNSSNDENVCEVLPIFTFTL